MDRDDDMLPYIEDGTILATMAQNSFLEEWMATYYLYWLKHNTVPAFPDTGGLLGAPQCPRDHGYGRDRRHQRQRQIFLPQKVRRSAGRSILRPATYLDTASGRSDRTSPDSSRDVHLSDFVGNGLPVEAMKSYSNRDGSSGDGHDQRVHPDE